MRHLAMDTASRIFTLRTQVSQGNNKDAIVVNLVIKDFAGQAYELTGRSNPPRSSSAKRYSSDSYSTFRFVATLALAPDQWMQILKSTHQRLPNFHGSHSGEVCQAVAQAVMRGDLTLYQLPSLNSSHAVAGKKGFGLSIIKGPNPHSATDLTPEAIKSTESAQQLLDELGISSQTFLGYLTNENLFNGEQKKNALSEALQLLASGELLAYKIPLPPKAPPAKAVEYVAAATADKPVPLAPEVMSRSAFNESTTSKSSVVNQPDATVHSSDLSTSSNVQYVEMPNDLIPDPEGVYGYMPTEASQFHASKWPVDWSNAEQVAQARVVRLEYHDGLAKKQIYIDDLRASGLSDEDIARKLVDARNNDRLSHYKTPEALEVVYERNLGLYRNKLGPTYESQIAKYGSPTEVINATLRTNNSMDILTGISKPKPQSKL